MRPTGPTYALNPATGCRGNGYEQQAVNDLADGFYISEEPKLIAANDNEPIGPIYKFEEAAEKLRVSKRRLQELVKAHPHYARNGRVYLFCENDIRLIWEGIHCHSSSSNAQVLTTGTSVAPSEAKVFSKLREQTTRKPPNKSASNANRNS
jgi:hypothetical protein